MKDIVDYLVKQFVTNPDAVEVNEEVQEGFVNVTLKVAPEDMGITIGKSGQTIKAIRRLLTIKAIADNVRVNLELIDNGPRPEKEGSEPKAESEESEEPKEEVAEEANTEEAPVEDTKEEKPSEGSEKSDS